MQIWINGKPYIGKRQNNPRDGYESVLMHENGVPVSEHTLPLFFLNGANVESILTGGQYYAKSPEPHL